MSDLTEPPPSLAGRLHQLAADGPDDVLLVHVGLEGTDVAVTAADLDRWASQLAGAMAAEGVGVGDRVALGLRPRRSVSPPTRCPRPTSWSTPCHAAPPRR